jgi:recombination protein RecA
VEKSGAWYTYNGERIGQGRETARTYLKDHPDALAEVESKVLRAKGVERDAAPTTTLPTPSDAKAATKPSAAKSDATATKAVERARPDTASKTTDAPVNGESVDRSSAGRPRPRA